MKKTLLIGMALGLTMVATSAMAAGPVAGGAGIVGSYHDLSAASYGDTQSRICVFCHHPHQAQKAGDSATGMADVDYSPLWNHNVTQATFTMYENGNDPTSGRNKLDAVMTTGPGGVSLLCLSCHDGTVALNAYSSFSTAAKFDSDPTDMGTGANDTFVGSRASIGGGSNGGTTADLSNHHPIGFNYINVVAADAEISDPGRTVTGTVGGGDATTIGDLLYGGTQFECVSCHDVHNSHNTGEKFLWISNDHSAFCLTCHLKDGTSQTTSATAGPATGL